MLLMFVLSSTFWSATVPGGWRIPAFKVQRLDVIQQGDTLNVEVCYYKRTYIMKEKQFQYFIGYIVLDSTKVHRDFLYMNKTLAGREYEGLFKHIWFVRVTPYFQYR